MRSVDQHNDLRQRMVWADLPGLPYGVGSRDDELIASVEHHYARVQHVLSQAGAKLFLFDIERHGAEELSAFLGCPVQWGCHNATR